MGRLVVAAALAVSGIDYLSTATADRLRALMAASSALGAELVLEGEHASRELAPGEGR